MAMANPATTADLKNRGYDLPDPPTVAQTRLDEVWRALKAEVRTLEASVAAGWIDTEAVADVVANATLRILDNPESIEQESYGIDDYQENRRRANATSDVYFTAAELRRLAPPVTPTAGSFKYS